MAIRAPDGANKYLKKMTSILEQTDKFSSCAKIHKRIFWGVIGAHHGKKDIIRDGGSTAP